MKRKHKKNNTVLIVTIIVLAVVLFALVPVAGDLILENFFYTDNTQAGDPTQNSSVSSQPTTKPGPSVPDTQGPTIVGAKDFEAYVGDTISYKNGVTVIDDIDPSPMMIVDNSKVQPTKPGVYEVSYHAVDASGNKSVVTIQLTLKEKPANFVAPEVIYAKADEILAKFIRPEMTDREKAEAVYVWTRRGVHLTYGSAPAGFVHEDADWLQVAYTMLNRDVPKGDCFYFFAVQKLLLQRLNIPTIDCEKIYDGDSHHYWLLVSVDGGNSYYHFDNVWSKQLCLVTDAELDTFSAAVDSHPFNRNPSLYPATPSQKLPAGELPWNDSAILNADF